MIIIIIGDLTLNVALYPEHVKMDQLQGEGADHAYRI
jgi:hypothetical protein